MLEALWVSFRGRGKNRERERGEKRRVNKRQMGKKSSPSIRPEFA